jgi:hypothetical protein
MDKDFTQQDCIDALGEEMGNRYWSIHLESVHNPEMCVVWADKCAEEALTEPDPDMKDMLEQWATKLRKSYDDYMIKISNDFKR